MNVNLVAANDRFSNRDIAAALQPQLICNKDESASADAVKHSCGVAYHKIRMCTAIINGHTSIGIHTSVRSIRDSKRVDTRIVAPDRSFVKFSDLFTLRSSSLPTRFPSPRFVQLVSIIDELHDTNPTFSVNLYVAYRSTLNVEIIDGNIGASRNNQDLVRGNDFQF